jgi:hypothetical protein
MKTSSYKNPFRTIWAVRKWFKLPKMKFWFYKLYKKDDDISETTKYEDVFIDNTLFSWMSRSRRTSESEEVATIINQPRNNIRVMLFIKKDDAEGTDFYYLGKMNYNSYLDTTMKSGESVVNIQFDMETPVTQKLYNYFEG